VARRSGGGQEQPPKTAPCNSPGYEVYRFGGHELASRQPAVALLDDFFARLLEVADPPE
jgi:hypothetical protein